MKQTSGWLALWALLAVIMSTTALQAADDDLWISYQGEKGPGEGKHIVFVTGDDEYRSEEAMPMLAKILAERHGFRCTVLFAINPADGTIKPTHQTNIPGTHLLKDADLMVLFTRFRKLSDEQMKPIVDFVDAGGPVIGLRTATHGFNYGGDRSSPYAKYTYNSSDPKGGFGQHVLGDTWINHHGGHGSQSTRGIANKKFAKHPILNGVEDVWGPSDVYGIRNLRSDDEVLLFGQVLKGMKPTDGPVDGKQNDPMMPLAWVRHFKSESGKVSRVFCTTMGASVDFESEGLRRLLVNACYWCVKLDDQIPKRANVEYIGDYKPTFFGFGKHAKGVKPSDHRIQ